MKEDFEFIFYNAMGKIQKNYNGKTEIIKNFIEDIAKYYYSEYYVEDENVSEEELAEQICNIANSFFEQKKYKKITKILNQEELEVVVSIALDEICKVINDIENGEE